RLGKLRPCPALTRLVTRWYITRASTSAAQGGRRLTTDAKAPTSRAGPAGLDPRSKRVVHYASRGVDRARRRRLTSGVDLAGGVGRQWPFRWCWSSLGARNTHRKHTTLVRGSNQCSACVLFPQSEERSSHDA